jgi:hypothetical protein
MTTEQATTIDISSLRAQLETLTLFETYDAPELVEFADACVKLIGRVDLRVDNTHGNARQAIANFANLVQANPPQPQSLKPITKALAAIDVGQHPPKQLLLLRDVCVFLEDRVDQILAETTEDDEEEAA